MSNSLVTHPPRGILRLAFRLPVFLYQFGLGWLLGERFVLLHHVGRKSGKHYRTVVEVVDHDQGTGTYFIVSGWGYKAQWYQNLLATPDIDIQIGSRKLAVRAETVAPEAGAQVLINYRTAHPLAARELNRLMGINISQSTTAQLIATVRARLPVVALRPRTTNA